MHMISEDTLAAFDSPDISVRLFHPRSASGFNRGGSHFLIDVGEGIRIDAECHHAGFDNPTILFFHGNGEIVADYQDIGNLYTQIGVNFIPVDYRGYGESNGTPTVSHMMKDADRIFQFLKMDLEQKGYQGKLIVMGRSLGSAPALEVAANFQSEVEGLIIESGFAYLIPLLRTLGVPSRHLKLKEEQGVRNLEKARQFRKRLLVIHAENDHIIPVSDGRALFENCPSSVKDILIINNADHNSIFYHGMHEYMNAIQQLIAGLAG